MYTTEHDRLRALLISQRKASGLTQSEMAKCLNRPQSYVSKYERGQRRLDVLEFLEVAHCLNIDAPIMLAKLIQDTKFAVDRARSRVTHDASPSARHPNGVADQGAAAADSCPSKACATGESIAARKAR